MRYASAAELRADLKRSQSRPITSVARRRSSPLLKYGIAASALITAAVALFFWQQQRGEARLLTDKDTIVLADFANTTGDPVFDETLRQGLTIQLTQSPFLSLISEDGIQRTLTLMGPKPGAQLTPKSRRKFASDWERRGPGWLIARLGSQYVLGLRAKNCRTSEILDQERRKPRRSKT